MQVVTATMITQIYFLVFLPSPVLICEAVLALLLPPLTNPRATVHTMQAN